MKTIELLNAFLKEQNDRLLSNGFQINENKVGIVDDILCIEIYSNKTGGFTTLKYLLLDYITFVFNLSKN